jgi:acyl carrier protein
MMTQISSAEHVVREFIAENLFLGADTSFDNDDSLLEAGALDSTAVMELVEFLQEHYSLQIENDEINRDNFETVNRIVAFIQRKAALAPAA